MQSERMRSRPTSRFDAKAVERLIASNESGRFEMEFRDAEGKTHVVSLPLEAAVDLGCLICDVSERTPFLPSSATSSKPATSRRRSRGG
jgi:hypothetical protein